MSGETLHNGHAFKPDEIDSIRTLGSIKAVPEDQLRRTLDIFVLRVGWKRMRLIQKRPSERMDDFERQLIKPLRKALTSLKQRDIALEFIQDDMVLRPWHLDNMKERLATFLESADQHLSLIRDSSRSGKAFDTDLRRHHVNLADCMFEFLGCPDLPSRLSDDANAWFLNSVRILAGPVFGRREERDGFSSLVRDHVDGYNNLKRRYLNGELQN